MTFPHPIILLHQILEAKLNIYWWLWFNLMHLPVWDERVIVDKTMHYAEMHTSIEMNNSNAFTKHLNVWQTVIAAMIDKWNKHVASKTLLPFFLSSFLLFVFCFFLFVFVCCFFYLFVFVCLLFFCCFFVGFFLLWGLFWGRCNYWH